MPDHDLTDYPYVWSWRWRTWDFGAGRARTCWFGDGVDRAGQPCQVLVRGTRNTALIEFADGWRVVTSRGGLRKASTQTKNEESN